jgi:hypothetical protein
MVVPYDAFSVHAIANLGLGHTVRQTNVSALVSKALDGVFRTKLDASNRMIFP